MSPPNDDNRFVMQFGSPKKNRIAKPQKEAYYSENLSSPEEKRRKSIKMLETESAQHTDKKSMLLKRNKSSNNTSESG